MSGKQLHRYMLICDGCQKTFGEDARYSGCGEARRAALAAGWQQVPKTRANGKPAAPCTDLDRPWAGHDVCPDCLATFKAKPHPLVAANRAHGNWFTDRLDEKQKRIDELERMLRTR